MQKELLSHIQDGLARWEPMYSLEIATKADRDE